VGDLMSTQERITPKTILGTVCKVSGDKTAKLRIDFTEKHPLYKKYIRKSKTLMFHDEKNECKVGDTVTVMETRPLAKTKRYRLVSIVGQDS